MPGVLFLGLGLDILKATFLGILLTQHFIDFFYSPKLLGKNLLIFPVECINVLQTNKLYSNNNPLGFECTIFYNGIAEPLQLQVRVSQ